MNNKGDAFWGHLLSTEHFGRESKNYSLVSKHDLNDPKFKECTRAGHCMIYAKSEDKIFDLYDSRAIVLMQMRFDGYIGFPGGLIEDGESVVQGLNRELLEEMNLDIVEFPVKDDDFVTAHFCPNKNICLNFYSREVSYEDIKLIESSSIRAGDYGSESLICTRESSLLTDTKGDNGFWNCQVLGTFRVPLYTMGDGYRGFPAFLTNNFAGNSKQQLTYSLVHLGIMSAQEIDEAEKAKPLHMDSN